MIDNLYHCKFIHLSIKMYEILNLYRYECPYQNIKMIF